MATRKKTEKRLKHQIARLRALANDMESIIKRKTNSRLFDWRKKDTPRRNRIKSDLLDQASKLIAIQRGLYGLANALEQGRFLDSPLAQISRKNQVESLMGGVEYPLWDEGEFKDWEPHLTRLAKLGIDATNFQQWHETLVSLARDFDEA